MASHTVKHEVCLVKWINRDSLLFKLSLDHRVLLTVDIDVVLILQGSSFVNVNMSMRKLTVLPFGDPRLGPNKSSAFIMYRKDSALFSSISSNVQ